MSQAPSVPSIQRLLPRHNKIMDLYLAGHDVKVIAETLKMTTASVSMCINSSLFQHEASKRRQTGNKEVEIAELDRSNHLAKAQSILERASEKAAGTLEALLDEDDPSIRFRGATAILDRALNVGKGNGSIVVNVTAEQVQLLQVALQESSNATGIQVKPANRQDAECAVVDGSVVCEDGGVENGSADSVDADAT